MPVARSFARVVGAALAVCVVLVLVSMVFGTGLEQIAADPRSFAPPWR